MTSHNIKALVTYDGTEFLGWQKTDSGPSIEESLQKAIEQVLRHSVVLQAASRTDAGVHASGQVVNFFISSQLDLGRLRHSLNCVLPRSISIKSLELAPHAFHPTLDCSGKEYHYTVCTAPVQLPQQRLYAWHYLHGLDVEAMREAACSFIGVHDFKAFCNVQKNSSVECYVREVHSIAIEEPGSDNLLIKITGTHFLYKMVRNIVGTLVYIGAGKLSKDCVPNLIAGKDRTQAGVTAPAHGLMLYKVFY